MRRFSLALIHFGIVLFQSLWYDLDMPSLTPKLIDGHTYYYARYTQRVDGKPKVVRTVYLGKLEDLVTAAEQSRQPPHTLPCDIRALGDVAALWDIAQRLDLVPLLDSILPLKRHQGLSCGQYLLLAAINRAVAPASQQTPVRRLVSADRPHSLAPCRCRLAVLPKLLEPHGPHHPRTYPAVRTADDPPPHRALPTRSPQLDLRRNQFLHLHQHPHPFRTAPARPQQTKTHRFAPGQSGPIGQRRFSRASVPHRLRRQCP